MLSSKLILWWCVLAVTLAKLEVVQVVEYCRHGARTAKEYFPNKNRPAEVKLGNSKLIPTGFHQHFILGKELKKKYGSLLGDLRADQVEILSSSSERTMESAWSQLMGLLSGAKGPQITVEASMNSNLLPAFADISTSVPAEQKSALPGDLWPVGLYVNEERADHIFQPSEGKAVCPKASAQFSSDRKKAYKEYANNPGVIDVGQLLTKKNFIADKVFKGAESSKVDWFSKWLAENWDAATIGGFFSEINGKRFYYGGNTEDGIDGLTGADFDAVERIQSLKFGLMYRNETMARFRADRFMREVLAGFDRAQNNSISGQPKKFRLFSGHDTGLFAVMLRLNLTSLDCILSTIEQKKPQENCAGAPPYASSLILELLKDDSASEYWVKGAFNNKTIRFCDGEEGMCRLEDFRAKMEQWVMLRPADYAQLCGSELEQAKDSWSRIPVSPWNNRNSDSGTLYLKLLSATVGILLLAVVWRTTQLCRDIRRRQSLARNVIPSGDDRLAGIAKRLASGPHSERETTYLSTTT